jgi:hypothetical protein
VPPARQVQVLSTHEQSPEQVGGVGRMADPPQPSPVASAITSSFEALIRNITE